MGLFKPNKKETNLSNSQKYLRERGIEKLSLDLEQQAETIVSKLSNKGLLKEEAKTSTIETEDQAQLDYLSAQVEQNWIIIKQQDAILKELQKIYNK